MGILTIQLLSFLSHKHRYTPKECKHGQKKKKKHKQFRLLLSLRILLYCICIILTVQTAWLYQKNSRACFNIGSRDAIKSKLSSQLVAIIMYSMQYGILTRHNMLFAIKRAQPVHGLWPHRQGIVQPLPLLDKL